MTDAGPLVARPLTPTRWQDLERLFGANGAYANCWCTFQRVTGREFSAGCANRGAGNRALLRRLTDEGRRPGLIGYRGGEPVGWVSVGPRPEFGRIVRSPITRLAPAERDDASVWSVVCFYIPRQHRRQGVGTALLDAAVRYARSRGAATLEAYPVDTRGSRIPSNQAYTGTVDLFRRAGFRRAGARLPHRPLMRLELRRGGRP
ncbi:MAG TPA: GNAT family N-acetyltransferase [Candidatus Limnocylindria bacterium]|nr:GNAT family N-acetyltransferase [Candidatus Limnocylindria bacterium]